MAHQITLIPGDGIGPEVADATCEMIAATGVEIQWDRQLAGICAVDAGGKPLPDATIASLQRTAVALKGPTTTPVGTGHTSVNVGMRRALDLYASVRPVRSIKGVTTRFDKVDLVIFRENTEGLYAGLEQTITPGVVISMKVVTEKATRRIAEAAFEFAKKNQRKKVTVVHKANILKLGDGMFIKICAEVAKNYPSIAYEEVIVDALCMRMVSDPQKFDILLMENLYGDIISDLCAGLVGGLGVVGGANLGAKCAIFEAVHGSAPDIAGKGIANPTALVKSAVMMLEHLGEQKAADKLNLGLDQVLEEAQVKTGDLGGKATTAEFTQAVIKAIRAL
jgi:isocitrate dehydrogenase (NAD+)